MAKTYFFCGVGGSGMMPLARIMLARGHQVHGSDRSYDQGTTPEKFKALQEEGIILHPQDGSGITADIDMLVTSTAVEPTIPDVKAALDQNIPIQKRAQLLAELFNAAETGISIAGTSGKSTVTGMVATILHGTGFDPMVMNGGIMRGFAGGGGSDNIFVTETDESDGSIALYNPAIAVVNNIALDHMPVAEITKLFTDFIDRAQKGVVLNFDDPALRDIADQAGAAVTSYAIDHPADLSASAIAYENHGVSFRFECEGHAYDVKLEVPGTHNVSNALAALSVAHIMGVDLGRATQALANFRGIGRRLEHVGTQNGITVIDDFAHNPDKIAASLKTLKAFDGRLIVIFQPHGFGPLRLMGKEMVEVFAKYFDHNDQLLMPEVFYAGGTVDRSVTSKDMITWANEAGVQAQWFETRADILPYLKETAQSGDRIIVMGARDDSLTEFAKDILAQA